MSLEQKIEEILTPTLRDMGLAVVRVQISGSHRKILEIMIERLDNMPVRMDDCVKANRESSTILDVEDIITESYMLNVTSPGLDRPLVKMADYKRFLGHQVKLETYIIKFDRKKFVGILEAATDSKVQLVYKDEAGSSTEVEFEYSEIRKANLVPDLDFNK